MMLTSFNSYQYRLKPTLTLKPLYIISSLPSPSSPYILSVAYPHPQALYIISSLPSPSSYLSVQTSTLTHPQVLIYYLYLHWHISRDTLFLIGLLDELLPC